MKFISICMMILLTSCTALVKHKDDIKKIEHDIIDEEIDKVVVEPPKQSQ
jgi:hypothetical protein